MNSILKIKIAYLITKSLTQIIYVVINSFDKDIAKPNNTFIFSMAISLGQMSVILYPYIKNIHIIKLYLTY